ncbi:alanine racemase [Halorhodospira abdelmalekii]|nr:alanine racemase [Halorhodospira abdelmalekii]
MSRGAQAVIDLAALRANLRTARKAAAGARVMAVVKSDGYGHGLARVAAALAGGGGGGGARAGAGPGAGAGVGAGVGGGGAGVAADAAADAFAVTTLEEALTLRRCGITQPVVLLQGPFAAADLEPAASAQLELVIHAAWQVEALEQASALTAPLRLWLKVDSGMNRLGFPPAAVPEMWRRLQALPQRSGEIGFMTHLACADDRRSGMTAQQLATFDAACAGLPGPRSAANSAGLLGWPESRLDWVRPGIMLYGASPFIEPRADDPLLEPVMTLQGRLVAIKQCARGAVVGYGATYRCPEAMPLGVVSVGYGDGYPRHAPSGTPVEVGVGSGSGAGSDSGSGAMSDLMVHSGPPGHSGQPVQRAQPAALVGRISMDMLAIDLRRAPAARPGDRVVLWGAQPRPETIAKAAGTIAYELFCQVTPRVERVEREEQVGQEERAAQVELAERVEREQQGERVERAEPVKREERGGRRRGGAR